MTTVAALLTSTPWIAALVVALVIGAIALLIWASLPEPKDQATADIERQCQSLRHKADHAVQHRPRVRANTCHSTPGHIKAVPPVNAAKPKACGGGLCRHQADCSDTYCPGRLTASLLGGDRHARH